MLKLDKKNNQTQEHIPVMGAEVLACFEGDYKAPLPKINKYKVKLDERSVAPQKYFDGTFGRGGHVRLVLDKFPQIEVVALDKDVEAIECAQKNFALEIKQGRLKIINADFSEFDDLVYQKIIPSSYDLMLLDLGVSSPQLDVSERGFSFYVDGPLDMRMNQNQRLTAETIVNSFSEENLSKTFRELGEVRAPRRVVKKILEKRKEKKISTTKELSDLIEKTDGWKKKGHHPATLYFMALRMAVNSELDSITKAVPQLIKGLSDGGRLVVISFHSKEDRLVKDLFKEHKTEGRLINTRALSPSEKEIKKNQRSRSAKLRAFQKGFPKEVLL